jgi:hypothetical protein
MQVRFSRPREVYAPELRKCAEELRDLLQKDRKEAESLPVSEVKPPPITWRPPEQGDERVTSETVERDGGRT